MPVVLKFCPCCSSFEPLLLLHPNPDLSRTSTGDESTSFSGKWDCACHSHSTSVYLTRAMELFQPSFGTYHIPILEECSSIASEGVRSLHSHPCPPLLKIIAIATTLETNIFPLTWRPALETLGEGLTGNVSQSPLNANISLAFKRLNGFLDRDSNRSDTEPSLSPFDAMLSEILVLSSPSIYDHPNVVNLEGLCWEIVKETEDVWPVMVFRKADSGNLPKFLSRPEALGLDSEDLISLCGEVAKGLQALHMSSKSYLVTNGSGIFRH